MKPGGGVELREIVRPSLERDAVLVRMKASGVCGTDLEKLTGRGVTSTVIGHEVAGIVVESGTDSLEKGDLVVPHHHVACNTCELCRAGAGTMCEGFKNSNFVPGGFADEFLVPPYNVIHGGVHKISTQLSFDEASFAEPLGCCIRGLRQAGVGRGSATTTISKEMFRRVLVVGAGPIGLLHMELIHSLLPDTTITTVDVLDRRLEFAEKNEHAIPIDARKAESGAFSNQALKETNMLGFDLVIVATGNGKAFAEGLRCARKSGSVLLFGVPHKGSKHDLDLGSFFLNETTITSSYSTTEAEIDEAIELLGTRKIDARKFISARFPLQAIEDAMLQARSEDAIKVVVTD